MIPHAVVSRAAEGRLPDWAVVEEGRVEHMARVSTLLGSWAEEHGLAAMEQVRWRSVGYLHDVLRDEDPRVLRERVPVALRAFPDLLLHGPAAAEHLRVAGVLDGEFLSAVAFHTVGDASFGRLGRALYAADFLEPGRSFLPEWRAGLRARMPRDLDDVVVEIARARIANLVDRGQSVSWQTVSFWNTLVAERS